MTLTEIYATRTDNRLVAFRPGKAIYVALGHRELESALANARPKQPAMTDADVAASDWEVGELIPHEEVIEADKQKSERERRDIKALAGTVKEFRKRA